MQKIIIRALIFFSFFVLGAEQEELGDWYQELGVSHTASSEEIKQAYRKAIKEVHPDLHQDKNKHELEKLEERFDHLTRIKNILLDPYLREEYDQMFQEQETKKSFKSAKSKKPKPEKPKSHKKAFDPNYYSDMKGFYILPIDPNDPDFFNNDEGGTLLHKLLPKRPVYYNTDRLASLFLKFQKLYGREEKKRVAMADTFIKRGVDINAKNSAGETPLILSIKWYYPDVFRLLLAHSADPNLPDSQNNTPLHWIMHHRNGILKKGSPGYYSDSIAFLDPLRLYSGRIKQRPMLEDSLKKWFFDPLFEKDLDLSIRNDLGMTVLELAVQNGYLRMAKLMIDKRGTNYLKPEERERILKVAIEYQWSTIVKRLADKYNPKTCRGVFASFSLMP